MTIDRLTFGSGRESIFFDNSTNDIASLCPSDTFTTVGTFGQPGRTFSVSFDVDSHESVLLLSPSGPGELPDSVEDQFELQSSPTVKRHLNHSDLTLHGAELYNREKRQLIIDDEPSIAPLPSPTASVFSIQSCPTSFQQRTRRRGALSRCSRPPTLIIENDRDFQFHTDIVLKTPTSADSLVRQPHIRRSPSYPKAVAVPIDLSLIKNLRLEFLIDQEGFRSAQPTFRFMGYSDCVRLLNTGGRAIDGGCVHFMPVKREAFHFHYAPLDGPPVLRRITVKDEDPRDYISRQAILPLKFNGPHSVQGTESLLPSDAINLRVSQSNLKVTWRLDYLVQDRRTNAQGRVAREGEKTLTPLTFSCSPALLHPLQGKKIKLVQVVKKSLTGKLVAERLDPPTLRTFSSSRPTTPVSPVPLGNNGKMNVPETAVNYVKSRMWNLHRRAQSHIHSSLETHRQETENVRPQTLVEPCASVVPLVSGIQRRRRASSAGERSRRSAYGDLSPVTKPSSLAQHIVDPAKLSELMTTIELDQVSCRTLALSPTPRTTSRLEHH
ncbi:hypothetical protein C8J56DRAFT_818049 [Mycena floridula]|nr:hypothetical protein C8J56DRAFT_818049 [Mycena floridula]